MSIWYENDLATDFDKWLAIYPLPFDPNYVVVMQLRAVIIFLDSCLLPNGPFSHFPNT